MKKMAVEAMKMGKSPIVSAMKAATMGETAPKMLAGRKERVNPIPLCSRGESFTVMDAVFSNGLLLVQSRYRRLGTQLFNDDKNTYTNGVMPAHSFSIPGR
jgi:hypothetical protein